MKSNNQIIVVGAGLSGLYLACLLKNNGIDCIILEASERFGGRIQTLKGSLDTPLEVGATWFSDVHENLLSLIDNLGLKKYPQFSKGISLFQTKSFEPPQKFSVPEAETSSYRLKGGTSILTDLLAEQLKGDQKLLDSKVISIEEIENSLIVTTSMGRKYTADKVVLTMPAQLISSQLTFIPELPIANLLPTVQTWMAGSIKFVLEYEKPFWRERGYSGMLYSHAGIITEMYDHTNYEETKFGFTGFLNPGAVSYSKEVRKELVLKQLIELLGEEAAHSTTYFDKVWKDEFILEGSPIIQRPHQNNGHPLLQHPYMNSKLFFCGTETSPMYGGYMEGAIISAKNTFDKIKKTI